MRLVSWVLQHEHGIIGNLYTMEDHRRKGLALAVVYEICRKIKAREEAPIVAIDVKNHASQALFLKLGFKLCKEDYSFLINILMPCRYSMCEQTTWCKLKQSLTATDCAVLIVFISDTYEMWCTRCHYHRD